MPMIETPLENTIYSQAAPQQQKQRSVLKETKHAY